MIDRDKLPARVKVINKINSKVTVNLPDLRFRREWPQEGAVVLVPLEVIEEGIYDIGFESMLKNGVLYIEDMNVKKYIGLEPDTAEEPENVIILDDNKMKWYWQVATIEQFTDILKTIGPEQRRKMAECAIENQYIDEEKAKLIKDATQIDIVSAILLNRKNEEK